MYTKLNVNSIPAKYLSYRLCYVEQIPTVVQDWTPESKEIFKKAGMSPDEYLNSSHSEYVSKTDYRNPNFKPGEQEMLAYFTPLEKWPDQIGEEWDDSDYEYASGMPYDIVGGSEVEILVLPFAVMSYSCMLPKDWSIDSIFSVNDINDGAVAWIFARGSEGATAIYGGDDLHCFLKKLKKIKDENPGYSVDE